MPGQEEYEARIRAIVKEAMANGVVWGPKEFAAIATDAIREVSDETAREMFGGDR